MRPDNRPRRCSLDRPRQMSLLEKRPGAPPVAQCHWGELVELVAQMLREHAANSATGSKALGAKLTEVSDE